MRFLLTRLGRRAWPVMLLRAGLAMSQHWRQTSREDRTRIQQLLRRSGGRPAGLTPNERRDLLESVRALELNKLMRDLATDTIRPGRRTRRARS